MTEKFVRFQYESATAKIRVSETEPIATLTSVYAKERGKGHASGLMRTITEYADANELSLFLSVLRFGHPVQESLDNDALVQFYQKFGFFVIPTGSFPVDMARYFGRSQELQAL